MQWTRNVEMNKGVKSIGRGRTIMASISVSESLEREAGLSIRVDDRVTPGGPGITFGAADVEAIDEDAVDHQ